MRTTSLQERAGIADLARSGLSDTQIAERLGWAVATIRKWRRAARAGPQALCPPLGRPPRGALTTFPDQIRTQLLELRTAHPGWGPKTLRAEVLASGVSVVPSRSAIARFLAQHRLSRRYERHVALPMPLLETVSAPHQAWQMDARGHEAVPEVGVTALIDITDVFSRAKILAYPCWVGQHRATRHPSTSDYQLALRLAFIEWGLPDRIGVDHDPVFYDNQSASPFPARLHLWLIALGVEFVFARKRRPTDQAIVERVHQTWYHQVLEGQRYRDWPALWRALEARREFLNWQLPCASLGERPPLVAHAAARSPRREYRIEREAEILSLEAVDAYLSRGRWYRTVSKPGTFALGGQVYYIGIDWARQQVEISYEAHTRQFRVRAVQLGQERHVSSRALTQYDLMGELGAMRLPAPLQLVLPFEWHHRRAQHLAVPA